MTETDDLIHDLGGMILRAARDSQPDWDYAGFVFKTEDGDATHVNPFLYAGGMRRSLSFLPIRHDVANAFLRLREVTRVPDDDAWKTMLMVLRREGGKLKFLFEFDDIDRWSITPANADNAYAILVGEVFPEALSQS